MSQRFQQFIAQVGTALAQTDNEPALLAEVESAMRTLVAVDDWLPADCAQPHPTYYQQYLLHCDAQARFSVVSFVWGPGQFTPIHDHLAWGVVGVLRGRELAQGFKLTASGIEADGPLVSLPAGAVAAVSPRIGDIHRVSNALSDQVSISIHIYGTDIGRQRRHVFDPATGAAKEFISGYANANKDTP